MKRPTLILLLVFSTVALSAGDEFSSRERENWYHQFGIAYQFKSWDDVSDLRNGFNFEVDFLRIYLPVNDRLLIGSGFLLTVHDTDPFEEYSSDDDCLYIGFMLSGSVQYYFDYIGKGFFIRGDLGVVYGGSIDYRPGSSDLSGVGPAMLIEFGFAFPVTKSTSLVLGLSFKHTSFAERKMNNLALRTGFLF